jgi:hypothetical protein
LWVAQNVMTSARRTTGSVLRSVSPRQEPQVSDAAPMARGADGPGVAALIDVTSRWVEGTARSLLSVGGR